MTDDDIIRMAQEAGLGSAMTHHGGDPRVWIEGADWHDELMRFAEIARLVEREACAMACMEEVPRSVRPPRMASFLTRGSAQTAAGQTQARCICTTWMATYADMVHARARRR